ncbi:zinc finger, CCHC-type containing protein [Tanacetum coccineum]
MVAATMSVVYVLTTPILEDGENAIVDQIRKRNKWDNNDYVCRDTDKPLSSLMDTAYWMSEQGLILKGMSDPLIDIYQNVKSGKEIWYSLEAKYMIDWIKLNIVNDNIALAFVSTSKLNDSILWHARLGHVHFKRMQDMSKDGLIPAFDMDTEKYNTCKLTKISKKLFQNIKCETKVLKLIHSDLYDLHATPSLGNKKYFVTFINDASRFCYVYLLHTKDEALDKFKVFKTKVELQQESPIKKFKTDRGGEYIDTLYFHSVGIIHEMTAPYTPQQNGIYERKNRVLKEMVNSMLSYSGLIVRLPDPKLKTLGERDIECIFVGYAEHSKAFSENKFSSVSRPSLSIPKGTKNISGSVVPEEVTETRDEVSDQHSYCFIVEDDPKIFDEAMKSQNVANLLVVNGSSKKLKVVGTIKKFKARLVIQGFKQKSGIEYFDTYTPVARISTIRLLIAMASIHNLIIHQMDQTPKQWHQKFDVVVLSNGYLLNQADKYVYSKFDESGKGVIICLYVDDMLIFGTDQVQVDLAKEFLSSRFYMKDMGEAHVILGIRIKYESNRIAISQSYYIEKVFNYLFNYFDCTPVGTPMDTSEKLMPNNGQAVSQLEYSRVIGCLMYVMTCTRLGIAFVVGKLSRYTSNPVLEGYTDASWISNTEDNSSTSGWVFLLGGGAISWASKKQTCITGLTMKYEFVALAAASKEAEWLKNLLLEIPLWSKPIAPISIRCDSAATLAKAYSQMYNEKSRHLGIRHFMIHELITNGVVSIEFARSQQNLGDYLTKRLARDLIIKSVEGM